MKLTCPACGATHSLEALLTDAAAREAVAAALALPAPLGDRLLRYLGLFRPAKRALSWDRAAKLLAELHGLIQAGEISRRGRVWPAPLPYWQQALDAVLEQRAKLQLPLGSHGYLLEIIAGVAARAEQAAELKTEQRRQQAARSAAPKPIAEAVVAATPERSAGPPPGWKEQALGKCATTESDAVGASDTQRKKE